MQHTFEEGASERASKASEVHLGGDVVVVNSPTFHHMQPVPHELVVEKFASLDWCGHHSMQAASGGNAGAAETKVKIVR